jgi:hypothetical protein
LSCKDLEPFANNTCVDTLLIIETDAEFAMFDLVAGFALQILKAVFKDVCPLNIEL